LEGPGVSTAKLLSAGSSHGLVAVLAGAAFASWEGRFDQVISLLKKRKQMS
jgi:hypothetical protein